MSGAPEPTIEDAYDDYLRAVRDGDRRRAFRVIDDAHAGGLDVGCIYLNVFQPALREIGRLWQENEIGVADEHVATAITQAAMVRLYERAYAWEADTGPSIVAACADVERHEVGLRMLCDLLELRGWRTRYLGAAVPMESLVRMVSAQPPDAIALSATIAPHLPRVRATVAAIRAALGDAAPPILVGGRAFHDDPALAARVGADLTAPDAAQAVALLEARVDAAG